MFKILELPIFSAMNLLKQATLLLFFESPWSEKDSCAPIFSMYMTLAQRTREDVKYFKVKFYIFFCNYLVSWGSWVSWGSNPLVSWRSNLRNLLVKTFVYHHCVHLGQSIQECTKIYLVHSWILVSFPPVTEIHSHRYRDTKFHRQTFYIK